MKNMLACASLSITLVACATENTSKPWQSKINENAKLAPQIAVLLGVKELSENCTDFFCAIDFKKICHAIYKEQEVSKKEFDATVEWIGNLNDWVPSKTQKVKEKAWKAYLNFKAKNTAK